MCDFLKRKSEGHVYGQPDIKSVSYHCSSGSVTVEMKQLLRGAAAVRLVASNTQRVVILLLSGFFNVIFFPQIPSAYFILPFLSTDDRSLVRTSERTLHPDITTHKGSHISFLFGFVIWH